jgi:hypothetical protein
MTIAVGAVYVGAVLMYFSAPSEAQHLWENSVGGPALRVHPLPPSALPLGGLQVARGNIHKIASIRYACDGLLYLFLGVLQVNQVPCKVLLVGCEVEVAVAAEVEEDDLLLA